MSPRRMPAATAPGGRCVSGSVSANGIVVTGIDRPDTAMDCAVNVTLMNWSAARSRSLAGASGSCV